jgi:hypothetical protein
MRSVDIAEIGSNSRKQAEHEDMTFTADAEPPVDNQDEEQGFELETNELVTQCTLSPPLPPPPLSLPLSPPIVTSTVITPHASPLKIRATEDMYLTHSEP